MGAGKLADYSCRKKSLSKNVALIQEACTREEPLFHRSPQPAERNSAGTENKAVVVIAASGQGPCNLPRRVRGEPSAPQLFFHFAVAPQVLNGLQFALRAEYVYRVLPRNCEE